MWHLRKIPKIAHFYWGNNTISYLRYLTLSSFKKLNPDWDVRLYTPAVKYYGAKTWATPEHSGQYSGPNYISRLMSLPVKRLTFNFAHHGLSNEMPESFKADFLRWYLLGTVGGLWSDFDIIYYRPMDQMALNTPFHCHLDTLICLNENGFDNYHAIGFLLGSAANPYYRFITSQTYGMLNLSDYQSIGSRIPNLYFPMLQSVRDRFPAIQVANIGMEVVYPIPYTMVPYIFHTPYINYLKEQTIGLHWFAGHPESLKFENLINEDSQIGYNNIIVQVLRRVM